MSNDSEIRKVAFIGDYLPRKCGIATYTADLRNSVVGQYPQCDGTIVSVDDIAEGYDYPPEVRFQIAEQELEGYRRAADFLNFSDIDVVSLQHEFGIYGGPAGSHILALLRDLRMPIVTSLHTVLEEPLPDQLRVFERLVAQSARLIVMSERGRTMLREIYHVPDEKIDVIPHGIPDMPYVDPNFYKDKFGVEGKNVLLTFGLLYPNKGIEYALKALPGIVAEFPNTVYIVLGATHPAMAREQGESYRMSLERMTQDLGIKKNVIFYNRFVGSKELTEFIGSADIYLTPYLNEAQITSGTLAYAFGCGRAVVSTPYWHAAELLADGRGVLVPFRDSDAICREVKNLLRNETERHAMRKRAYLQGRDMVWSNVAHLFMHSFKRARRGWAATVARRAAIRTLDEQPLQLPRLRFDHLLRMTDSTGIFQYATHSVPNFRRGYSTDDNARALVLTVLLEELGEHTPEIQRVAASYAAFLDYAFDAKSGTWRKNLSFDRQWQDADGLDEFLGRKIWALGTCVGRSPRRDIQLWAVHLFEPALNAVMETTSPRTWAYALMGIHDYLRRFSGDRLANQVRDELTSRLMQLYQENATDDWPWLEDHVAGDNARIPHALILSGRWTSNDEALSMGLRSLGWLSEVQRSPSGCFRPIGNHDVYVQGKQPAEFDQLPIEAGAMVSACIEAYRTTDDSCWLDQARLAFEWFLGRNDLGLPLYDTRTGGCCDGLHEDRVNQNQGGESTLSWLTVLAEMKLLEGSLAAYDAAPSMDGPRQQSLSFRAGDKEPIHNP
jgi:glycosyltransferase involved in cell wall biosynthesis